MNPITNGMTLKTTTTRTSPGGEEAETRRQRAEAFLKALLVAEIQRDGGVSYVSHLRQYDNV